MTPAGANDKNREKKTKRGRVVLSKAVLQSRLVKPKIWQVSSGWPAIDWNYDRKQTTNTAS
jgi:hypothetical protein